MAHTIQTKHFVWTFVGLVGVGLSGVSAFAWSRIQGLHLPVHNGVAIVSTILPLLDSFAIYGISQLLYNPAYKKSLAGLLGLFLVDTSLLSLTSGYLPWDIRESQLTKKWTDMYIAKSLAIKHIQDTLHCCGYKSPFDRFYPFPAPGHKPEKGDKYLCEETYPDRKGHPCFTDWSNMEQNTLMLFLGVAFTSALMKAIAFFLLKNYQAPTRQFLNKPLFLSSPGGTVFAEHGDFDEDAADFRDGRARSNQSNGTRPTVSYGSLESDRQRLLAESAHDEADVEVGHGWRSMQPSSQVYVASTVNR